MSAEQLAGLLRYATELAMTADSWILDVKNRLGDPAPRASPRQVAAHTVFVPLFVDTGDLWVLMSESDRALAMDWGTGAFPGGSLKRGQEPWERIAKIVEGEVGVQVDKVLRLGELDAVETVHGFSVVPCVGAIPLPDLEASAERLELFALPLSALQNPQLVEDRQITVDDNKAWIRIYHMGRRRIAGVAAQILEGLFQRLLAESSSSQLPHLR